MTSYARICYGTLPGDHAHFYGAFSADDAATEFERFANQCFGIRKSIEFVRVEEFHHEHPLPDWVARMSEAHTFLTHHGDTIVWDASGKKIKSEWDGIGVVI